MFVGRTKEGVSLNKVMIGYAGWTMERAPMNDATLPILADGVKWLGCLPKRHLVWNLGFYGDAFSEGQTFSSYENQLSGRVAWVPVMSEGGGTLLHIGISERYGKPNNDKLKLRARPGAWPAPYFVDTGDFATDSTAMTGLRSTTGPADSRWDRNTSFCAPTRRHRTTRCSTAARWWDVAHHGRDAQLQHPRRLLQSGLAEA